MKASLLIILAASFLYACSTSNSNESSTDSKQDSTKSKTSLAVASNSAEAEKSKPFSSYGEDFKQLILSYEGVVRNVNLGMTADEIKKMEKSDLVGENKRSITYKDSISPVEYVDIEYYINPDKQVDAISMHIFLDNQQAFDDVLFELSDFFTRKYGKPTFNRAHDEIWKPNSTHEIDVISRIRGQLFEIEVEIN